MAKRKAKKTANKPKKVWLSRDGGFHGGYELFTTKPEKDEFGDFQESGPRCRWLKVFCPSAFEDITGFRLEPGECCRVTIHIEKV